MGIRECGVDDEKGREARLGKGICRNERDRLDYVHVVLRLCY